MATTAQPSLAPFYLAHESGYFGAEGIYLEIEETRSGGGQVVPLIAGGAIDISFGPMNPATVNAVAKGARIRLVAGREILSPGCSDYGAIYGHKRAFPNGFRDYRELKGKTIAVSRSTGSNAFVLDVLLESAGMAMGDVRLVSLPQSEAIAALKAGQIHALVSQNFYGSDILAAFPEFIRHPGLVEQMPGFQYSFVFFGARMLDAGEELGGRFLRADLRGAREFIQGRTPRFLEEFARTNGLKRDYFEGRCRETYTADGEIKLDSVRFYVDWAVRRGYVEHAVAIDKLFDHRFLDYARRAGSARLP